MSNEKTGHNEEGEEAMSDGGEDSHAFKDSNSEEDSTSSRKEKRWYMSIPINKPALGRSRSVPAAASYSFPAVRKNKKGGPVKLNLAELEAHYQHIRVRLRECYPDSFDVWMSAFDGGGTAASSNVFPPSSFEPKNGSRDTNAWFPGTPSRSYRKFEDPGKLRKHTAPLYGLTTGHGGAGGV
jgi:hypothetical protein